MVVYVVAIKDVVSEAEPYIEFIGYHETEDQARHTIDVLKKYRAEMFSQSVALYGNPDEFRLGSRVTDVKWWNLFDDSYTFDIVKLDKGIAPYGYDYDQALKDLYVSRNRMIEHEQKKINDRRYQT